jgi:UPF0716 protein FxsA
MRNSRKTMRIPFSIIAAAFMLAEIAAFILVGQAIGVPATLGLVLFSMLAGTLLLRRQGLATLAKVQADLGAGRVPARPLAEGAVLALAAVLIIIPGFVSDLAGIALFVPAVRATFWRSIRRRVNYRPPHQKPAAAARPAVLDLNPAEYGASQRARDPGGSPWSPPARPPRGPEA